MSEYLQNKEHKENILKSLIGDLHRGRDFDEVKKEFDSLVQGVDATEIASMEQKLIEEGMPPEEIKKLCDVHAAVFRDQLMSGEQSEYKPGHPLHTLRHENAEAARLLEEMEGDLNKLLQGQNGRASSILEELGVKLDNFRKELDRHYSKKENIFFPYLERHQITGPPSVMWSVDDEIRDMLKELARLLREADPGSTEALNSTRETFSKVRAKINEMFFKEDHILSPMMADNLTEQELAEIKEQSDDFGVIFSSPGQDLWQPGASPRENQGGYASLAQGGENQLTLETGFLTQKQINAILTNLPVDITFVDENDEVRYFSQGKERIFTRTKSIIGRKVQNCHPPESVHMVERIVTDFKSGKHDNAEFWLELNGAFVHIRYFALKDHDGRYLGTMEVSQDITKLRALEGERRLLQYSN